MLSEILLAACVTPTVAPTPEEPKLARASFMAATFATVASAEVPRRAKVLSSEVSDSLAEVTAVVTLDVSKISSMSLMGMACCEFLPFYPSEVEFLTTKRPHLAVQPFMLTSF